MFLFLLASGPAEIEIQFELGSNLQFKLSRQKMCVSMVENVDKKSGNHRSGSNISSHVVFIYSLLIAFILAVLLGIFVTLMQKKYEAQLAKNDIVQSKPAAGKLFFGLRLQLRSFKQLLGKYLGSKECYLLSLKELFFTGILQESRNLLKFSKYICLSLCLFLFSCFHAVKGTRLEPT